MAAAGDCIVLHADAPPKPSAGDACNGCGVCCAAESCPPARLAFRRCRGPCPALGWDDHGRRYLCRLVSDPGGQLPWLPRPAHTVAARFFARAIAVGRGCDCDFQCSSQDELI